MSSLLRSLSALLLVFCALVGVLAIPSPGPTAAATTVTLSLADSAPAKAAAFVLKATVKTSSPVAAVTTGKVKFTLGATATLAFTAADILDCTNNGVDVDANGVASCVVNSLADFDVFDMTADYVGNNDFAASTTTQTMTSEIKSKTTIAVSDATPSAIFGRVYTVGATVKTDYTTSVAITAGKVSFTLVAASTAISSTSLVITGCDNLTPDAQGIVSCSMFIIGVADFQIKAIYAGDTDHTDSDAQLAKVLAASIVKPTVTVDYTTNKPVGLGALNTEQVRITVTLTGKDNDAASPALFDVAALANVRLALRFTAGATSKQVTGCDAMAIVASGNDKGLFVCTKTYTTAEWVDTWKVSLEYKTGLPDDCKGLVLPVADSGYWQKIRYKTGISIHSAPSRVMLTEGFRLGVRVTDQNGGSLSEGWVDYYWSNLDGTQMEKIPFCGSSLNQWNNGWVECGVSHDTFADNFEYLGKWNGDVKFWANYTGTNTRRYELSAATSRCDFESDMIVQLVSPQKVVTTMSTIPLTATLHEILGYNRVVEGTMRSQYTRFMAAVTGYKYIGYMTFYRNGKPIFGCTKLSVSRTGVATCPYFVGVYRDMGTFTAEFFPRPETMYLKPAKLSNAIDIAIAFRDSDNNNNLAAVQEKEEQQ